jgi:hypothetical protein
VCTATAKPGATVQAGSTAITGQTQSIRDFDEVTAGGQKCAASRTQSRQKFAL